MSDIEYSVITSDVINVLTVIKIVTFKGVHLMWSSDFPYHKELLLKEQNLSFKRSSCFKKGRNRRESLLYPVVSLCCA